MTKTEQEQKLVIVKAIRARSTNPKKNKAIRRRAKNSEIARAKLGIGAYVGAMFTKDDDILKARKLWKEKRGVVSQLCNEQKSSGNRRARRHQAKLFIKNPLGLGHT